MSKCALLALVLASCSTDRRNPPPVPVLVSAPAGQAPVQALVPPQALVADLVFDGERLLTCDEFSGPADQVKGLFGAQVPQDEVLRDGQSCAQATSNKPPQASCTREKDGVRFVAYYYDAKAVTGTDKKMRECLKVGGTWSKNESHEAHRERLEQNLKDLQ